MQAVTVAQLKEAFRKAHLKRLRTWAKTEPTQLRAASQQVCDHLYNFIQAHYRHLTQVSRGSASDRTTSATPLFIFAYAPLYYEVDLVPLMRRLWSTTTEQRVHILTPVALHSPSGHAPCSSVTNRGKEGEPSAALADPLRRAMVFVEILDEADLETNCVTQGNFKVREFSNALLTPWLMGPGADAASGPTSSGDKKEDGPPHETTRDAECLLKKDRRVRHMVLCDSYSRLFPVAHASGYRPAGLLEYASECATAQLHADVAYSFREVPGVRSELRVNAEREPLHLDDVAMLILVPGVLFDLQTGRRIGKGCGYYDRFLAYHGAHHACGTTASSERATASASLSENAKLNSAEGHQPAARTIVLSDTETGGGPTHCGPPWEVMAVAFDSQVLCSSPSSSQVGAQLGAEVACLKCIPVEEHDQLVHSVVSPSGGVKKVRMRSL
ncbi:hypothetical protein ABL78_7716 [Leptomonas seymouri]|uniref:5-formyltetrahydrofolate cyclo-ligase n=1 Tax=Leptomonas seymouri TaxID=5684 RepID=A0A0N1I1K4_LEPSE|nr:hypothetical protein ABL78_7716 [Leptomonas seymouri]|eukprot:KPI83258.1 hypothetical protein ABL78_7716 [Leptomonas seymouri]